MPNAAVRLNTDHFRSFLLIVEAGGVSAAARRVGRSQSSVSRELGALERALGVELFARSPRRWELTVVGRAMLGPAQDVVHAAEALLKAVDEHTCGAAARLRRGQQFRMGLRSQSRVEETMRMAVDPRN